jgi:aryl-alcohol dehydrogenase-like predicted oxidoreductase
LQELFLNSNSNGSDDDKRTDKCTTGRLRREDLIINTKVGRYEKELDKQFDFSREATMASVERSLRRLQCCCSYIDVLQLHDAEFAPNLQVLLQETIPAMITCRNRGWCKALGLTGYPLAVQRQILQCTLDKFGPDVSIWDQSLTYGHYNLHDQSLFWPRPSSSSSSSSSSPSFFQECVEHRRIAVLAAAPLSMGLLTSDGPPAWHPAGPALKQACRRAVDICKTCTNDKEADVDIASIAVTMSLTEPRIPCTLLGMKNIDEVQKACDIVTRLEQAYWKYNKNEQKQKKGGEGGGGGGGDILQKVLSTSEYRAYQQICNVHEGPFALLWKSSSSSLSSTATSLEGGGNKDSGQEKDARYDWDGVQEVRNFYSELFKMVNNNDDDRQPTMSRDMVTEWQVIEPPIPVPSAIER